MLYLSSRIEPCCSSWVSVPSICDTWVWVELICDWFGAEPGSVVDVLVAPAPEATSGAQSAASIPATIATRVAGVAPPAVARRLTALTW